MAIFSRKAEASFASAPIKAAAGSSYIGQFLNYQAASDELRALSIPTVSRSRDLLVSIIGALELRHYTRQWTGERYEKVYLPLEDWMETPDPKVTRSFFYGNIMSDLMFHGRAFAYITARYENTGLPAQLTWLPNANITTPNQVGPQFFGQADVVMFNSANLDPKNVIQFISPIEGIISIGARAINTALYLDAFADKLSRLETVPGYLQQVEGEDLSGEELGELAQSWADMRKTGNSIGALSRQVHFKEFSQSPAETVAEQRKYQALELARLCSVPAYLVSAPTEGESMVYSNAQGARQDLYLFGARVLLDIIQQTLSSAQVLPANRFVEFDVESYLYESNLSPIPQEATANERQVNDAQVQRN
jgi:hypothetical protein